jgi:hypothetical protein
MMRENNIKNFLREYKELCKKYDVSLGHEDEHGGFILYEYDEEMIEWVEAASDGVEDRKKEEKRIADWKERAIKAKKELQSLMNEGEYFHRQLADKIPETKEGWDKLYTIRNSNNEFIRYATKNEITLFDTFHGYELWHGEVEI